MVNVGQYQIVATGSTVAECESAYRVMLANNNLITSDKTEIGAAEQKEAAGVIAEIRSAVVDGNTRYFIRLQDDKFFYSISAADDENAVILNVGDYVTVKARTGEGSILSAVSVTRTAPPQQAQ